MSTLRRRAIAIASIAGLILLGATSATAHDIIRTDTNEPSDEVTLDTKNVIYRHVDGRTVLKVTFYDEIQRSQFTDSNSALWQLWTKGDSEVDFVVEYEYLADPGRFFCTITDFNGDFVARVPATKRALWVRCIFLNGWVGGLAEKFVVDAYDQGGMDFAPNNGAYHHN